MIYKEINNYSFWLLFFLIGFGLLNIIYFNTICLSLLLHNSSILELSYENGLSLLNLEVWLYLYILALQSLLMTSIYLFTFLNAGLLFFEVKIIGNLLILNLFIFVIYIYLCYDQIENTIFYSSINSSSNIIILNPDVTNFIIYNLNLRMSIYLLLTFGSFFFLNFYLIIIVLNFKNEIIILFIYIFILSIMNIFHANSTIQFNINS